MHMIIPNIGRALNYPNFVLKFSPDNASSCNNHNHSNSFRMPRLLGLMLELGLGSELGIGMCIGIC